MIQYYSSIPTEYQNGIPIATASGTVDVITATYTSTITLSDMTIVAIVASGANTSTTPTFAPNGLTAHTIVKNGGSALAVGDIAAAGMVCLLEYNLSNTRWELLNPKASGGSSARYYGATFDGGGVPITANKKAYIRIPVTGTITAAFAIADITGSISISVWKDTFANYPPVVGDKISASAPITITNSTNIEDITLTGWIKSVTAGDIICFNVDALATSITWCSVGLLIS
jgi:hypothetical protein